MQHTDSGSSLKVLLPKLKKMNDGRWNWEDVGQRVDGEQNRESDLKARIIQWLTRQEDQQGMAVESEQASRWLMT